MYKGILNGMGTFTTSKGIFKGTLTASLSSKGRPTRILIGKGEYGEGRRSPATAQQRQGGKRLRKRNEEKRHKKGIIIVLFTCTTPGTHASKIFIKNMKQLENINLLGRGRSLSPCCPHLDQPGLQQLDKMHNNSNSNVFCIQALVPWKIIM